MDNLSINVRRVMLTEGIKLELEEELQQLQEYTLYLKHQHEVLKASHISEREEIAKSYVLECEKTGVLTNELEKLNVEVESLRLELGKRKKKEEELVDTLDETEDQKQLLKMRLKKAGAREDNQRCYIRQLENELRELRSKVNEELIARKTMMQIFQFLS